MSSGGAAGVGGTVDTSAEEAAIEAAFSGYADSYCPAIEPCCAEDGNPYDQSGCEQYIQGEMSKLQDEAKAQVAAGHHLSQAGLKQCLEDRLAAAKACDRSTPESCRHVWVGNSALGELCSDDDDCAQVSGVTVKCRYDDGADRCIGFMNVHAGDACTWTSELPWPEKGNAFSGVATKDFIERYCVVAEGNTCRGSQCTPISGQPGDQCQMFSCVSGYYCGEMAQCAPRPTEGGACRGFLEDACATGLFCNATLGGHGTCEPKRSDGQSCSYAKECSSGLCYMQQCGQEPPGTFAYQCGG